MYYVPNMYSVRHVAVVHNKAFAHASDICTYCILCSNNTMSFSFRMCGNPDIKQMSGKHFVTKRHVLGLRDDEGLAQHHFLCLTFSHFFISLRIQSCRH